MVIAPLTVTSPVLPPLARTPVAPLAACSITILPPLSMVTSLLESSVIAAPLVKVMLPPLLMTTSSAALPVAFAVRIGVVRPSEMVISAWAPAAASKGAIATAVASSLRIRKKPLVVTRSQWGTP